jgi:hypothetical protein
LAGKAIPQAKERKEQPLQKRISVLNKAGGADFAKLLANKVIPPGKERREEKEVKEGKDKNKEQKKEDIKIEQKPAQKRISVMNKVGGVDFAKLLAAKLNNPNQKNPPKVNNPVKNNQTDIVDLIKNQPLKIKKDKKKPTKKAFNDEK